MRLLLDECVSGSTRVFLHTAGHDLVTVRELGRASAPNGEILNLANAQQCILVTVDRGLGDVTAFPLGTHHGIIVLKILTSEDVEPVHRHLRDALNTIPPKQVTGSLLIVDRNKYRLRRPP